MNDIALVADLHGNWPATRAVDADIRARGIHRIWCLGDVVGKGPSSPETMDWAVQNCEFILRGNWDEGIGKKQFPKDEFYYRQLGGKRLEMLLEFPLEHTCLVSGQKMRLFHGRPIMPEPFHVQQEDALFAPYFEPDWDVVGYADTHRQGMRILGQRGLLFNTGSVGNGMGVAMAQYAILRGVWNSPAPAPLDITLVTVPYDRDQAVRDVRQAGEKGLVNADLFEREILTGIYARNQITGRGDAP